MKSKLSEWLAALAMTCLVAVLSAPAVLAQDEDEESDENVMEEVMVTGSRIKRSPADQMAPTALVDSSAFAERGYVTSADALNRITDMAPIFGLNDLRQLDLSGNLLENIKPLRLLEGIWRLNLDRNPINDISPLLEIGELELVSLRGIDNLSCEVIDLMIGELGKGSVVGDGTCF